MSDYSKAVELDPSDPATLINRGLLYANQKAYGPKAAEVRQMIAALQPR